MLWHSLFLDERSWSRVEDELAADRRLILITGPGHGASTDPGRRYTMEDCADAARAVLDALAVDTPVDWVGNAWGGHVGIVFAAKWPTTCRTLTTIGTPVHSYARSDRLQVMFMLLAYRLLGPTRFLRDAVAEALLSSTTRQHDSDALELIHDCFANASRAWLRNAVVSISLRREDLSQLLPRIEAPTLFITGTEHADWTPQQADAAIRLVRHGSTAVVPGVAYVPQLEAPTETTLAIRRFWATPRASTQATHA